MDSTIDLIIQQGENVLVSMKDLKRKVKKKGKERAELYEKLCANLHSFNVYTYINPTFEKLAELKDFQQKIELFSKEFASVIIDFDTEVNLKQVESIYEDVLSAYKAMVNALDLMK
jgi:hypothetical protein